MQREFVLAAAASEEVCVAGAFSGGLEVGAFFLIYPATRALEVGPAYRDKGAGVVHRLHLRRTVQRRRAPVELKKWAAKNASQSRAAFHHGPEAEISFRARTKTGSACVGRSPRSSGWVPFGLGPAGQGRPRGPQKRILTAVKRCPQRLFLEGRTKERPRRSGPEAIMLPDRSLSFFRRGRPVAWASGSHTSRVRRLSWITRAPCRSVIGASGHRSQAAR
jgi:hypothetical protein